MLNTMKNFEFHLDYICCVFNLSTYTLIFRIWEDNTIELCFNRTTWKKDCCYNE